MGQTQASFALRTGKWSRSQTVKIRQDMLEAGFERVTRGFTGISLEA
jgi:hypothetical protein